MGESVVASMLAGQVIGAGDGAFVIAEWRDPGAPADGVNVSPRLIAPLHLHRSDDEAWYVLEGTLVVQVGDQEVEARAGAAVFVPRGTPHTYWNPNPEPARYLLVMTQRIYRMIQELHTIKERTPEVVRGLFEKYDSVLL